MQGGTSAFVSKSVLGLFPAAVLSGLPACAPHSRRWVGLHWPRVACLSLNYAAKHWSWTGPPGSSNPLPSTATDFVDAQTEA